MTNNPISDFEQRLRKATKWRHHNDAVKEIVGHYHDLYQEALLKGASVEEARKHAESKIGNVSEIAKGIRSGNSKSIGMKLQWIAMALLVFGAFLPRLADMNGYEIGSLKGNIIEATYPIGLTAIYAAGFLAGLGMFKAKKISIPAFGLGMLLIPLGHSGFIIQRFKSFSNYDLRNQAYANKGHQYAVKYRPIMNERYDLYVSSITGTQKESEKAIRKLSASVIRPQDRGVVILDKENGKWIYPLDTQAVRARNIRVFPLRVDNLNWVNFGATDSFEIAQKEWSSSDELLKAIPTLRKGSEAEFALASSRPSISASQTVNGQSLANFVPFITSCLLSFLMVGIANSVSKLTRRRRKVL